jgi:hypothetical protein
MKKLASQLKIGDEVKTPVCSRVVVTDIKETANGRLITYRCGDGTLISNEYSRRTLKSLKVEV